MTDNEKLKFLRTSCGMTAAWCAKHVGKCNPRTWAYWEGGRDGRIFTPPANIISLMQSISDDIQARLSANQ